MFPTIFGRFVSEIVTARDGEEQCTDKTYEWSLLFCMKDTIA